MLVIWIWWYLIKRKFDNDENMIHGKAPLYP